MYLIEFFGQRQIFQIALKLKKKVFTNCLFVYLIDKKLFYYRERVLGNKIKTITTIIDIKYKLILNQKILKKKFIKVIIIDLKNFKKS